MLTMRWVFCIVLLCLCAPVYSQEPPLAPRIEAKEQTKDSPQANRKAENNSQTISPPPSLTTQSMPNIDKNKRSEDTNNTGYEASEYWAIAGHRVKVTDTLLVAFTCLLFVATVLLYFATRSLVTGAEETAKRQLRAYISIVKVRPVKNTVNPELPAYAVTIRNSGQTPAYSIKSWRGIGIQKHLLTSRLSPPPSATPDADVVLGNGTQMGYRDEVRIPFSQAEMDDLRSGKAAIYYWGRFEYSDSFNRRHFTNFCLFRWDEVGEGAMRYSHIGNDTDQDGGPKSS